MLEKFLKENKYTKEELINMDYAEFRIKESLIFQFYREYMQEAIKTEELNSIEQELEEYIQLVNLISCIRQINK